MSFRKLFLPTVAVAGLGFFGVQGPAVAAPEPDGKITAKEVRTLIVETSGATKRRGINPRSARIQGSVLNIRSTPCSKGNNWRNYSVSFFGRGGKLCNGAVRRNTRGPGKHYFESRKREILDHILTEANLDGWGPGRVMQVQSNGKVATVHYWNYSDGQPTNTAKMLRIVGSKVTVKDIGPSK